MSINECIDKTHFADDATLKYIAKIESKLAAAQELAERVGMANMVSDKPNRYSLVRGLMQETPGGEFVLATEHDKVLAENAALLNRLHEIAEIYAGMEGFIPQTAPEDYQQSRLKQMYEIAAKGEPK